MIEKQVASLGDAVADVADGSTVMIGGFGTAGLPNELVGALLEQGAKDLTIVNNNAGNGDTGLAALIAARRVRKIVCSFPRQADSHHFDRLYRAGEIELELVPQGNLAERIRAAGAGIGGFFTPTGYGTDLAKGKETREIDGRMYVLEAPLARRLRLHQGRARRPLGQPHVPHDGAQLRAGDGDGGEDDDRDGARDRPARRPRSGGGRHARASSSSVSCGSTASRRARAASGSRHEQRNQERSEMEPRRDGAAGRARHPRRRRRQPRHRPADPGRQPPAERARGRPAQRERRHRHGPGAARRRRGLRPHQRRQAAGDAAAGRLVLPPRRQLRDDARRPSRRLRPRRVPGRRQRRPRQLAHRRGRRDPGRRRRDGPRHRRQEDLRDDGAHDQGRRSQDRRALQLPADRHRLRRAASTPTSR